MFNAETRSSDDIQKLASVCSTAKQELDKALFARLKMLLSVDSPILDSLVQEAALNSTIILVQK